jgi:formamidopyrimidine-DNA glycosylase
VHKLSEEKLKLLFKETKKVLQKGIDFNGDSMSDYRTPSGEPGEFQNEHNVYRRTGKSCNLRGCKGIIARVKVGGRSAHYCPVCQK